MIVADTLFTVSLIIIFVLVIVPLGYWIVLGLTRLVRRDARRR